MSLIAVRSIASRFLVLAGASLSLGTLFLFAELGMAQLPAVTGGSGAASAAVVAPVPSIALEFRTPVGPVAPCQAAELGSPYIPLDSWVYPSLARLNALGYADLQFLGLRPYTRASVLHILEDTAADLEDAPDNAVTDQAQELFEKLQEEMDRYEEGPCFRHMGQARLESSYTVARVISGTPLHDSYHIGESVTNDYGRPIEGGFNSGSATWPGIASTASHRTAFGCNTFNSAGCSMMHNRSCRGM
jgi:hypothetical protein